MFYHSANKRIIPLWNKLFSYEEDSIMDVFIRNPANIVPIHITTFSGKACRVIDNKSSDMCVFC
mgnify:CR=1 FL=1